MAIGAHLRTAVDIIASPGAAFARLRERPVIWFPLLLIVGLNAVVTVWYMSAVDLPWMLQSQLEGQLQGATPEARDQMIEQTLNTPRTLIISISTVSAAVLVALILFVSAVYLVFVSMLTGDGFRLRQWFSLVCWTSLPGVISQLAVAVNLLISDVSRLPQTQLNPLSFANLFGLEESSQLVAALDPTQVWSLVLLVLGYQVWTKRSIVSSAAIVLAPVAVIVGLVVLL